MFLVQPHARESKESWGPSARSRELFSSVPSAIFLRAEEWKYVGEGGANVLFRHCVHARSGRSESGGRPAPAEDATAVFFQGQLLRVKKCDVEPPHEANSVARVACKKKTKAIRSPHPAQVVHYVQDQILPVMTALAGQEMASQEAHSQDNSRYCQVAQLLHVPKSFLLQLNDDLLKLESRPAHRRHSQIDLSLESVMVIPDVMLLPSPNVQFCCDQFPKIVDLEGCSSVETMSPSEDDMDHEDDEVDDDDNDVASAGVMEETASLLRAQLNEMPQELRRQCSEQCRNIFDCCFRSIGVELKPKVGFMPDFFVHETKRRVCRFCMHQHLKRIQARIEEVSGYCPMDLYSNDKERIKKAFVALQKTPQNNFKVFVRSSDGDVIDVATGFRPGAVAKREKMNSSLDCQRVRFGFRRSCCSLRDNPEYNRETVAALAELMTETLTNSSVLNDLKQLQMLDYLNIEGVWCLQQFNDLMQVHTASMNCCEMKLAEVVQQLRDKDGVDTALLDNSLMILNFAIQQASSVFISTPTSRWEDLSLGQFQRFFQQVVERFHVATTLKDCSILMSLHRVEQDGDEARAREVPDSNSKLTCFEHLVTFRHMTFRCVIAIVDLDFKCHKAIADYFKLDQRILDNYTKTFGDSVPRQCDPRAL